MSHESSAVIDPHFKMRNPLLHGQTPHESDLQREITSDGYKGYIQGSIAGATLFGTIGAVLGLVGAVLAAPFLPAGLAVTSILPLSVALAGTAGALYGKATFGSISATAAMLASQAQITEERRNLLDRYYETPSAEEAKEIEKMLQSQREQAAPEKPYHWKAGLIGATVLALAAVVAVGIVAGAPELATHMFGDLMLHEGTLQTVLNKLGVEFTTVIAEGVTKTVGIKSVGLMAYAAAAGVAAVVGSIVGLDRAYIRKWFDMQTHLHEDGGEKTRLQEHERAVERLREAYHSEGFGLEARGEGPMPRLQESAVQGDRRQQIPPRTLEPPPQEASGMTVDANTGRFLQHPAIAERPTPSAQLVGNDNRERKVERLQEPQRLRGIPA